MSSSAPTQSPAPSSPMRQQLDELDALLQRLLTLPVNHQAEREADVPNEAPLAPSPVRLRPRLAALAEKPSSTPKAVVAENSPLPLRDAGASPVPRSDPPAGSRGPLSVIPATNSVSAPVLVEPPPLREENSVISIPNIVLPEVARKPESEKTPNEKGADQRRLLPLPDVAPAIEPLLPKKTSAFLQRHEARIRHERRAAPWRMPLGWINRLFDRCAVALGRPGLWLVRSEGRDVLGWIGIGLLLAAAVILAGDWFGWTW